MHLNLLHIFDTHEHLQKSYVVVVHIADATENLSQGVFADVVKFYVIYPEAMQINGMNKCNKQILSSWTE